MKIAILTDSSSGLSAKELPNLFVLSLPIILEDNMIIDDDINNHETEMQILKMIEKSHLKTSFINPSILENKIIEILKIYDYVIFLPIAYNLSSEYENSLILLKNKELEKKLLIAKHHFTGIQLGKFVFYLADKINQIKDIAQLNVEKMIIDWSGNSLLMVIPGTLENLSTSGRVTNLISSVLEKRKFKVGIFWKDKAKKIISRNYNNLLEKYINQIQKQFNLKESEIYIAHTKLCDKNLLDLFKTKLSLVAEIKFTNLPTIFAVYGGVLAIGLVIFKNQ